MPGELGQLLVHAGQNARGLGAVVSLGQVGGGLCVGGRQQLGSAGGVALGGDVDNLAVLRAAHEHVVLDLIGRQLDSGATEVPGGGHGHAPGVHQLDVVGGEVVGVGRANLEADAVEAGADGLAKQQLGRGLVRIAVGVGEHRRRGAGQQGHDDDDRRPAPQHREQRAFPARGLCNRVR